MGLPDWRASIMGRYVEKPLAQNMQRFGKLSGHDFLEIPVMII
jgi:hypothetical protein